MFNVLASGDDSPIVYIIQEIPGTQAGTPRINIMSASKYGKNMENLNFYYLSFLK